MLMWGTLVKRAGWISLILVLGLVAAACGSDSTSVPPATATPTPTQTPGETSRPTSTPTQTPTAEPQTVASDIKDFVLQDITIPVGTTVDWTNRDSAPHTTTSGIPSDPTGFWDSPFLSQEDSFPFTFNEEGTFQYYCRVHPDEMQAVITVGPAGAAAP